MRKQYRHMIAISLLALALPGCGSNGGEEAVTPVVSSNATVDVDFTASSADVTIGADGVAIGGAASRINIISATMCLACHTAPDLVPSDKVINSTGYLASKHVVHSLNIDQNTARAEGCKVCHDPIGDGPVLASYLAAANVPPGGLAAVTCEVCHGAGGQHNGVGEIPDANPNYEVCGHCHNALPDIGNAQHPAMNIISNFLAGKHYNAVIRNSGVCMRCHTDEGYETYIGGTIGLDGPELIAAMADKAPVGTAPLQCRTCHDPHSLKLRAAATLVSKDSNGSNLTDADGNRTSAKVFSSQFNLCTSCHQAFLHYTYDSSSQQFSYTLDGTRPPFFHPTFNTSTDPRDTGFRTIWDTHFKYLDPADQTTVLIPGYDINAAADDACTRCHDPHSTTIP